MTPAQMSAYLHGLSASNGGGTMKFKSLKAAQLAQALSRNSR
jgi:hypothetical protein